MAKINGTAGNDHIAGTNKKDTTHGLGGDDIIFGGQGNDTLYGDEGNDILHGGTGDDILIGGDGDDVLIGTWGADTLTGGAGADTFKIDDGFWVPLNDGWNWSPNRDGERDTITDFESGVDKVDFSGDQLLKYIDTNGDGISEVYSITWADVEVLTLDVGEYRVVVHQIAGNPQWDLGIDVLGTMPVETDFIF
jgi:Ca2+-binding RTX toxin-like protein